MALAFGPMLVRRWTESEKGRKQVEIERTRKYSPWGTKPEAIDAAREKQHEAHAESRKNIVKETCHTYFIEGFMQAAEKFGDYPPTVYDQKPYPKLDVDEQHKHRRKKALYTEEDYLHNQKKDAGFARRFAERRAFAEKIARVGKGTLAHVAETDFASWFDRYWWQQGEGKHSEPAKLDAAQEAAFKNGFVCGVKQQPSDAEKTPSSDEVRRLASTAYIIFNEEHDERLRPEVFADFHVKPIRDRPLGTTRDGRWRSQLEKNPDPWDRARAMQDEARKQRLPSKIFKGRRPEPVVLKEPTEKEKSAIQERRRHQQEEDMPEPGIAHSFGRSVPPRYRQSANVTAPDSGEEDWAQGSNSDGGASSESDEHRGLRTGRRKQ